MYTRRTIKKGTLSHVEITGMFDIFNWFEFKDTHKKA